MEIIYTVRRLDSAIQDAYRRLLPEQAESLARGKLDWKFERHPASKGAVAVATMDGGIVGMVAFAPARLKVGQTRIIAHQALDTVVDPVCRGRGAFVGLGGAFYGAASEVGCKAVYGFPNENAAPGWFGKLGWARLDPPPFLVKPLNAGYFARRLLGRLGGLADSLPLSLIGRPRDAGRAVRIDRFDERVNALWAAFSRDIACAVDRADDYLNWRLFDHPAAEYQVEGVFGSDGSLRAFVATHVADKHGGRIGYIMEAMALPDAGADLVMLLRAAIDRMRRDRTDAILAWSASHAPNYRAFRRVGFWPMPERIRPIHLYFGGRSLSPEGDAVTGAPTAWYLSYLDSDTV